MAIVYIITTNLTLKLPSSGIACRTDRPGNPKVKVIRCKAWGEGGGVGCKCGSTHGHHIGQTILILATLQGCRIYIARQFDMSYRHYGYEER